MTVDRKVGLETEHFLSVRQERREKERSAYPTTAAGDGEEPVEYDDVMKSAEGRRSIYLNIASVRDEGVER